MSVENGEWVIRGLEDDDPRCVETPEELLHIVNTVGLLPLFANPVPGFSVEEMTSSIRWWSGDSRDPWEWRMILASSAEVAYGKFFGGRAGFVSLELFPYLANWRRDGYDFDALWDEGKAHIRSRMVMDAFNGSSSMFSFELKNKAGFGKGGEKYFDGTVIKLQQQTYLVTSGFEQRINKKGQPYGWHIAKYAMPESIWGYDMVTSAYGEEPQVSGQRIVDRIRSIYGADETTIRRYIEW